MRPTVNKDLPIYKQLAQSMKEKIIEGEYVGGDKLPSIRENASVHNVSLISMMNAYQELEKDGLVSHSGNNQYTVNNDSSVYVNDFYLKRIAELYLELKECCQKAKIDNLFEHLKKIDKNL